jgi:hypothetical protein
MLLLTPIYTWPQNLGLAQIEAIVQEIEQEKEAGKIKTTIVRSESGS